MQPWYWELEKLVFQPYAFFETRIKVGRTGPASLFFGLILCLTGSGWCLVKKGGCSLPGPVLPWGILLPLLTYPAAVLIIYLCCHLVVRGNRLRSFFAVWGFSYLPTFALFGINIIFHGLVAYPWLRSLLIAPAVQTLIWTFIILMFFWKLLLLAMTLRLAGNLNLYQIAVVLPILALVVTAYWVVTFSLGWLRVPFI